MKIAVVGSRNYPDLKEVENYVSSLPSGTILVSGGARGVDSVAESVARKQGFECIILKPDWKRFGKAAGVIRNKDIVEIADRVVAFWDGKSAGTAHTIGLCQKLSVPYESKIWVG